MYRRAARFRRLLAAAAVSAVAAMPMPATADHGPGRVCVMNYVGVGSGTGKGTVCGDVPGAPGDLILLNKDYWVSITYSDDPYDGDGDPLDKSGAALNYWEPRVHVWVDGTEYRT